MGTQPFPAIFNPIMPTAAHSFRAMATAAVRKPSIYFPDYAGRVSVRRERLNSEGYTSCGVYFGTGSPLYFMQDEDGEALPHGHYFRASDRGDAVAIARASFPSARIRP